MPRSGSASKDMLRAYRLREKQKIREFIYGYKQSRPCMDCRQSYPHYMMDFDHVRDVKRGSISDTIPRRSMKAVLREMAKCELVCSNCHRRRTWMRRSTMGRTIEQMVAHAEANIAAADLRVAARGG